jgi:hypothetical protein
LKYTEIKNGLRVLTVDAIGIINEAKFQAEEEKAIEVVVAALEEAGFKKKDESQPDRVLIMAHNSERFPIEIYFFLPAYTGGFVLQSGWEIVGWHSESQSLKEMKDIFSHIRSCWKQQFKKDSL